MNEKVGAIHKRNGLASLWSARSWEEKVATHMKAHECFAVAKEVVMGQQVLIGSSAWKFFDEPEEYPSGYYKTAYAIMRGEMTPVQWCMFDGNHEPELTENAKHMARINKTKSNAIASIELGIEGGLYEK